MVKSQKTQKVIQVSQKYVSSGDNDGIYECTIDELEQVLVELGGLDDSKSYKHLIRTTLNDRKESEKKMKDDKRHHETRKIVYLGLGTAELSFVILEQPNL